MSGRVTLGRDGTEQGPGIHAFELRRVIRRSGSIEFESIRTHYTLTFADHHQGGWMVNYIVGGWRNWSRHSRPWWEHKRLVLCIRGDLLAGGAAETIADCVYSIIAKDESNGRNDR